MSRNWYRSLYYAQVPMALSAALFVWCGAALCGRVLAPGWYAAAFFGTWAVYLRDAGGAASAEDAVNVPGRRAFYRRHRLLRRWGPPLALAAGAVSLLGVRLHGKIEMLLAVLAAVGAGYTLALIPLRSGGTTTGRRLKDFGGAKAWAVSLAWLGGGLALPLIAGQPAARWSAAAAPLWIVALVLFLLLMIDTVALDWRDIKGDRAAGIRTLAVSLGWKTPIALATGLAAAGVLVWLAGPFAPDARWLAGAGTMLISLAAAALVLPLARPDDVVYGSLVMAWRWTGALALAVVWLWK